MKSYKFLLIIIFLGLLLLSPCIADNLSQQAGKYSSEKVYQTALNKHLPFFLVFYAQWEVESSQYIPIINQTEAVWGDRVLFVKVDVEDQVNIDFINKFKKFEYLPYTMVFDKNGEIFKEFTNAKDNAFLEPILKEIVKSK